VKDELGDGRVGIGITGVEHDDDEVEEEEEGGDEMVVVVVLPRMSSM